MHMTDEKLVQEFLGGDQKALEILVEKYLKPIYNFVFQLTQDTVAAEDITQDVFVKAWRSIESFDKNKKFSTWLYAIARNTALDWLKRKKAIPFSLFEKLDGSSVLEFIEDDSSFSADEILKSIDVRNDVEELLSVLPLHLKTILILHNMQGFSLVEIAEIMGQSANTTKSQYRRAILELRQQVSSKNASFEAKIMPSV